MSEELWEGFALGHKKVENGLKHMKKFKFFKGIACFLQAISSNHEQITHIAFFKV